jgi:hypothetical protein
MKPLDIVRTPKGAIGIIKESRRCPHSGIPQYRLDFIGNAMNEKRAWWREEEGLKLLTDLPTLVDSSMDTTLREEEDANFYSQIKLDERCSKTYRLTAPFDGLYKYSVGGHTIVKDHKAGDIITAESSRIFIQST